MLRAFSVSAVSVFLSALTAVGLSVQKLPSGDLSGAQIRSSVFEKPEDFYADYDSIVFTAPKGGEIELYLDGTSVGVRTDCAKHINLSLYSNRYYEIAGDKYSASFETDISDYVKSGELYNLTLSYDASGVSVSQEYIWIMLDSSGDLRFISSPVYEHNVAKCEELLTDSESLKDYLGSQNDIETDSYSIQKLAKKLTKNKKSDWDKSLAIYDYITGNFAYDYVQTSDYNYVYQDDAALLLRRNIAVCEGLANVYVALCRAAGIPACLSYGISFVPTEVDYEGELKDDLSPNHAWACVCLGGKWYMLDPTWDCNNAYNGDSASSGSIFYRDATYDWYLQPLETFSMTHKITDADTTHSIPETGSCGTSATYDLTWDGTLTIKGSGAIDLPYGLDGFRKVVFEEGSNITKLEESCFNDCDVLEQVILPDTVTEIGDYAFYTCEDLEYVYIPEGVTRIGNGAFSYCDELAYIRVPDSVTEIGIRAFEKCPRLIVSLPSTADSRDVTGGLSVQPLNVMIRKE